MSAYDTGPAEIVRSSAPAVSDSLSARLAYAREMAQSGLVPSMYRGRPANVLVAIETGNMLGVTPMAAVLGIYVIDGQPAYKAGFIAAMVRRAGHRMRTWWDAERQTAVTTIHRREDPEFEYRSEWDLPRAQRARLVQLREDGTPYKRDHKGNPLPWETYPENLCKARTISECARDACEDLFYGSPYVPEELGAQVDAEGTPLVVEHASDETGQDEKARQEAVDASAARIDWDADLQALEGNYDGLRQLWALASEYGDEQLPEGFRQRIAEAGERAKAATSATGETSEDAAAEDDETPCRGIGVCPDDLGDMTIVGQDGTTIGMCRECTQWVPLHHGVFLPHAYQRNAATGE